METKCVYLYQYKTAVRVGREPDILRLPGESQRLCNANAEADKLVCSDYALALHKPIISDGFEAQTIHSQTV